MNKGRHEVDPIITIDAAWNDEHEAALEDTEKPTILQQSIQYAVDMDQVLTNQQVRAMWDDRFLTNVMIPFLQHIEGVFVDSIEEARKTPIDEVAEAHWQAKSHALDTTIHALREWRG